MTEKKGWLDQLSETVDKAVKAAGEAWDSTADIRKETWEKTKAAGTTASTAIEEGVEKAKSAYKGGQEEVTPGTEPTNEGAETAPETDDREEPPANG